MVWGGELYLSPVRTLRTLSIALVFLGCSEKKNPQEKVNAAYEAVRRSDIGSAKTLANQFRADANWESKLPGLFPDPIYKVDLENVLTSPNPTVMVVAQVLNVTKMAEGFLAIAHNNKSFRPISWKIRLTQNQGESILKAPRSMFNSHAFAVVPFAVNETPSICDNQEDGVGVSPSFEVEAVCVGLSISNSEFSMEDIGKGN